MKKSHKRLVAIAIAAAVVVLVSRYTSDGETPVLDAEGGTTVTITRVVDGDTVYTSDGGKVRVIGYDTPEHDECGFDEAKALVTDVLLNKSATLVNPSSVDDEDRYGRWLRYVEFDGKDLGTEVLTAGLGHARYDGLDGYDNHPRQDAYRSIDAETAHLCD